MRKLILIVSAVFVFVLHAAAQNRTVTGKVTDDKGAPVEGVSVTSADGKQGTQTDKEGIYSISLPASVRTLMFSNVNFESQSVSVGTKLTVNATLKTRNTNLEEVVVVGYGTQQKVKVTGSIIKLGGDKVSNLATTSFDKQLAGRVSGVQAVSSSGLVSEAPRIRIRGVNSLTQGRDPLIVLDGVPTFSGSNSSVAANNVLADINPADIESYEVLKDGAAAAIYGSRASNGVILITTKKGKTGKLNVNYDMYMGFGNAFRIPQLLGAADFITVSNEKLNNANLPNGAFADAANTNTNWFDNIFNKNPFVQSHTVSANGGSDKSTYYMSISYLSQDGIVRTNYNRRYSFRANMEHRPNRFFKFGNNITLTRTEDNDQNNGGNALSGAMAGAMRALPNVGVYSTTHPTGYNITTDNAALGSGANTRVIENNYTNIAYVLDKNIFNNQRTRVINNLFLDITPVKGISFRTQASVDYQTGVDFQSYDKVHGDGRSAGGTIFQQSLQSTLLTWQNYATFNKSYKRHTATLVVGTEMSRELVQNFNGRASTVSDPFFQTNNLITNTYVNQFSGGFYGKRGFQSYFGRFNYDFDSRYFFQFTLRRDGLGSLPEENRYGNFFGGSLGWRISEEKWWKQTGLNRFIDELKFRGSYAEVGNAPGDRFPYLSTYGAAPYGGVSGLAANVSGNTSILWETAKKINYGFDMVFWKNRVNLSVDIFKNKNDNLLFDAPQPPSLGIPNNRITKNIGEMENKGVEIELGVLLVKGKAFTWRTDINFTSAKNKVLALAEGQTEVTVAGPNNGTFNILRLNNPINAYYGYTYAGVNSANGNPMWYKKDGSMVQYNNVPGAAAGYYFAINKDDPNLGVATTLGERYIVGSPLPTWYGGFSNTFSYNQFSLDVFFRYSGGNYVYNLSRQEVWNSQGFVNNGIEVLNRWKTPGQVTDVPKLYYGRDNQVNLNGQLNTRFLEKGDFLRLQNLVISYNVDSKRLETATNGIVKTMRWYVQGQNLFVWTKYKGIDPENTLETGIDNASVPQLRSFTFGLNVGF
ncbi:MAG: TonB-dependent receptor [Chitinophagaceae bacterium]|nr:TonB-dependent receptor [Chitinophagaceae bacterium]MBK9531814.1 TonB-dependent receptor [Chitinophagaceae bacterium]